MSVLRQEIELFGRLADPEGPTVWLELSGESTTVAALRAELRTAYPALGALLSRHRVRAAVDDVLVDDEAIFRPGQSISFMAPASGG